MRPVNLIPPEQRRGDAAVSRTGPLAYALVGLLCVALIGVVALVVTGNQIADRETEVAELTAEQQELEAEAERLRGYTEFRFARLARLATVKSLAESRFDWERVMRELSLVLPDDVWLTSLSGSVSPEAEAEGSAEVSIGEGITGPSLSMVGCAAGHDAVAGFIAALRDIDGVTRVGFESSDLPESSSGADGAQSGGSSGGGGEECRTREFISQFKLVVAFDAAPVPITGATEGAPAPAPAPPAEEETPDSEATPTSNSEEGG